MGRNKAPPYIKATLTVVFWGASFIATKVVLRDVSPITVVWLRFAMGVVILGMAVAIRRQFSPLKWSDLPYFALLGFLGITLHQWLQSNGLLTSQASTSAWIIAATPVFMALLGWIFLSEKLTWLRILGIALAALGVVLVVTKGDLRSLGIGQFGAPGDKLVLWSAVNWAIFSALSRPGLQSRPAAQMMFYVMLLGWSFTSYLFFTGPGFSEVGRLTPAGWIGLGFLGVFCSGLAYIFWYDALQVIPTSQVGVFLYFEPLTAVVVAAIILGEPLLAASLVGGCLILIGVWMVNRQTKKAPV